MIFIADGAVKVVPFVMRSKTRDHEHEQQTRRQLLIPSPLQTSEDKNAEERIQLTTHQPSGTNELLNSHVCLFKPEKMLRCQRTSTGHVPRLMNQTKPNS